MLALPGDSADLKDFLIPILKYLLSLNFGCKCDCSQQFSGDSDFPSFGQT